MENYQSPPMFKIFAFLSCEVIKNNASFKNTRNWKEREKKREKNSKMLKYNIKGYIFLQVTDFNQSSLSHKKEIQTLQH